MGDEEIAVLAVKMALDSGSFDNQLKDINNDIKIVESEFKATGASAKTFGDSLDGLEANLKRCNDVLELQKKAVDVYKQKVEASEKRVEKLAKKHEELADKINFAKAQIYEATEWYGENSKEVEELNKELKNLESRYANNEKSLLSANSALKTNTATYNNAIGKVKQYEKSIKDTEQDIKNFGKAELSANDATGILTTGIGILDVALGSLLSGGIGQLIEWFIQGIQYSIEFATTIDKVSQQVQMTTEEVQKWDYAFKTVGLDLESVSGDLANFNEKIQDTLNGTGDGAEVFTALKISVQNADGTLRSTGDVLQETVMKLQNMEDQTLRNAYASKLLSTTGEEMIPILNMTNEELAELQGKAGIVKDNDIAALKELKESLLEFMEKVGKPIIGILGDIAKILSPLIDLVGAFLEPILWGIEAFTSFIGDGFEEAFGDVQNVMGDVSKTAEKTAGKTTEAFEESAKSVAKSFEGATEEIQDALGIISDALGGYYDEERKAYEKSLEERYGDSKKARVKIALMMQEYDEDIERKKAKDIEKYSKLYLKDTDYYAQAEEAKTKKMIEESNKRIAQQNKEKGNYSTGSLGNSSSIPSYDTGTQYHLGGLAMVHKDELVDLPRGTKVNTVNQSREILRETNNTTNNSPIVIQNLNVQTNNVDDFLEVLEDRARRR